MNLTIPIPDNLDSETVDKLHRLLVQLAQPEWAMLIKFYTAVKYEVDSKGDSVDIKATVRK